MQEVEVRHGQQVVFLLKAFCEVGGTGEARFESDLSNIIALLLHKLFGSFKPVFFEEDIR